MSSTFVRRTKNFKKDCQIENTGAGRSAVRRRVAGPCWKPARRQTALSSVTFPAEPPGIDEISR